MQAIQEHAVNCPYCGEVISLLIDSSEVFQDYIEDCEVCCRPIRLQIDCGDGSECTILTFHENDTI
ncbi:CPXCG motif-containing cysteine-rich protein [Methylophaga frappieri]|uniref:CPXCG motif-containing cysteine-rich protein n=1 Tax=Methylophaga frappieri (strain ATCC BAA-2434 / DSM 25690 / JAM7) TaxID=754477 RepID=UPI000A05E35D|nr:CPXCG motif-containing cysteine-rich protein [Methylophaga frappieri]